MTSYISAFITRRFSRPGTDADSDSPAARPNPSALRQSIADAHPPDTGREAEEEAPVGSRTHTHTQTHNQNDALDRVLAGDEEDADVLSPMSIGSPSEEEIQLRRIDRQRIAQTSNLGPSAGDHTRSRGETDPLPRRPRQRSTAADLRRGSWQARLRNGSLSLSGSIENTTNPRAGAAGYVDDPGRSRSVRASVSSNMSMNSSAPGTPEQEVKGPLLLPEDDGMRMLRGKIQAVQSMDVSPEEKSRMMHILMTEKYTLHHGKGHRDMLRDPASGRATSPAAASLRSVRSQDAPLTPRSEQSGTMDGLAGPNGEVLHSPSTSVFTTASEAECQVTSEDLRPTYYSKKPPPDSKPGTRRPSSDELQQAMGDEDMLGPDHEDEKPLGCAHYMRNVKLQCHACLAWYTCRFCHDDVEDHNLERRKTRNMLCMFCGTAQPAGQNCRSCGEEAACYYCNICKLWDNDPTKSIYHCDDCGICRIGEGVGKDFFHCKVCDVCISMSIRDTHKCIERSVDCDCPICGEYMFTSPQTVVFMRCGHSIHQVCYKKHLETSFKCPICSKSLMNMEMTFGNLSRAIELQPMPEEFRDTRALIVCNDCRGKTIVPYHWLGLKCGECDSYNTAQLQIVGPNEQADGAVEETMSPEAMSGFATPGPQSGIQTGYHTPRGRSESGNVLARPRRPTSTSAIQNLRMPLGPDYFYPIANNGRSISAMGTDRIRPEWAANGHNAEAMDVDDEDDLDFWGRDLSPRPRSQATNQDEGEEGENDDESESDDDDLMDGIEDDVDDDEDDGMLDGIEIFGHR